MQALFAALLLVVLVACAFAQWPYYPGHYHVGAPLAYNPYAAAPLGYNYYGAYNPALSYLWKK